MNGATPKISTSVLIALGLISMAGIAFQIVLMQILSTVQWHHFASMVISVALLGFGAAGTFLSLFRQKCLDHFSTIFPLTLFLSGLFMSVVIGISDLDMIRFDSYLLFTGFRYWGRLILTYLLFFIPFFFGALAVGMTFVKYSHKIGKIYFANLVGSALGSGIILLLMRLFLPHLLPSFVAAMALLAGLVVWPSKAPKLLKLIATITLLIFTLFILKPAHPQPSEYKSISKTLLLPEAKVEMERSSPHGLVQVVSSPVLRSAPGLSLNYRDSIPVRKVVFNNGNWIGSIIPAPQTGEESIFNYTIEALAYQIKSPKDVLVLNSGTGERLSLAVVNNVPHVIAVEPNGPLVHLLKSEKDNALPSVYKHPSVKTNVIEARTFLMVDTMTYDLINLPSVGSLFGTTGLNALQEQYLLTEEAFGLMWEKLRPEGLLCISSKLDYPPRNTLRLLATIMELLKKKEIESPDHFIVAIKSWSTLTFLIKRTPFTSKENNGIRSFCHAMSFDPVILSDLQKGEREQYNTFRDTIFFHQIDQFLDYQGAEIIKEYAFRIHPTTDNRPYFSQFIHWKSLSYVKDIYGTQALPFFELGYILILLTLVQVVILAALLILLPLVVRRGEKPGGIWSMVYFSGIGLGYMFTEILFIRQFILFLGSPINAAAGVIGTMLLTSGIGSYFSSRIKVTPKTLGFSAILVATLIILYGFFLTPLLQLTIALPVFLKTLTMFLLVGIPGFFMGIPFPSGITWLARKRKNEIPWAWGVNGYFSVIAAVLATILSVELGFLWVMLLAALFYGITAIAGISSSLK